MKDSYYFPHDYNAKWDQKILMLRAKYDNIWWYWLFFMILESMAEEEDGYIDRVAIGGLSISYWLPIDKLTEFIDYCINIWLFLECKSGIYSRRMSDHKKTRKSLSEAWKQWAKRRWDNREAIATPLTTPMQRKGKERKGEESKEKDNIIKEEASTTDVVPWNKKSIINKFNKDNAVKVYNKIKEMCTVIDWDLNDCVVLYSKLKLYWWDPIDNLWVIIQKMRDTWLAQFYSTSSPEKLAKNMGTIVEKLKIQDKPKRSYTY